MRNHSEEPGSYHPDGAALVEGWQGGPFSTPLRTEDQRRKDSMYPPGYVTLCLIYAAFVAVLFLIGFGILALLT